MVKAFQREPTWNSGMKPGKRFQVVVVFNLMRETLLASYGILDRCVLLSKDRCRDERRNKPLITPKMIPHLTGSHGRLTLFWCPACSYEPVRGLATFGVVTS